MNTKRAPGTCLNIMTPLHQSTKRDYLARMMNRKVECMQVARQFEDDFWDGDRQYGYGGYHYDGRWKIVAQQLIDHYRLPQDARILDVGCGKGYLLYEFSRLLPSASLRGFDVSAYALAHAKPEIADCLLKHDAKDPFPFGDMAFDLAISLTTLFNLPIYDLKSALGELERVARFKYLTLESYRNETELFNLQCWALTCQSFFSPAEWEWLFSQWGFSGDYEFIFFE